MNRLFTILLLTTCMGAMFSCTRFDNPGPIFEDGEDSTAIDDRRILYINIEGAVGEIVREVNPATIASLLPHSKYSFYGLSEGMSNNGTTWTSIMTGVNEARHHIETEDFGEIEDPDHDTHDANTSNPSIYYRIFTTKPHYRTFAFVANPLLIENVMREATDKTVLASDEEVKDHAIEYLKTTRSKFGIINFEGVKKAGLASGFSADNPAYVDAINQVDAYIGEILAAIEARPDRSKEKWMIVIQSNNGGVGTSQGGDSVSERNTFSLYYYPSFIGLEFQKSIASGVRFYTIDNNANRNVAITNDPSYLEIGDDGAMTFECFVWRNQSMTQASNIFLLGKADGNGQNDGSRRGWFFGLRQNTLFFHVTVGTTHAMLVNATTLSNKWTHFAGVIEKVGNKYLLSFYQDGVPISKTEVEAANPSDKISASKDFEIGGRNAHSSFQSVDVNISHVRMWNRALTAAEVAQHACMRELPADLPYLSSLEANYPLEKNLDNLVEGKPDLLPSPSYNNDFQYMVSSWNSICEVNAYVPANTDLAPNVFYWLKLPSTGWTVDGRLVLEQFDQEFYNR